MDAPIFQAVLDDSDPSKGLSFVSLVEEPAVEIDFVALQEGAVITPYTLSVKLEVQSEEKRIISGVAMLADTAIPRYDSKFGKYYIMMNKDTIRKMVVKFFKERGAKSANEHHSDPLEGVIFFESYITDEARGVAAPNEFENIPNGSWVLSAYVESDEAWQKVKDGEYNGFSIEGYFDFIPFDEKKELIAELAKIEEDMAAELEKM